MHVFPEFTLAITSTYSIPRAGPNVCLPVYYERLVLDPKTQMRRILKFLGVQWDESVIHHEQAIGKKGGISLSKYVHVHHTPGFISVTTRGPNVPMCSQLILM